MVKYGILVVLSTFIGFQLISSSRNSFLRKKAPKIDVLRGYCRGLENAPIQIKNIRIINLRGVNYISGKLVVKQDNFTQFQVLLKTKRCISKEALDTCEPLPEVTMNKMCNILNQKNQPWSPFVDSMHPRMECPIKNGTYIIRNGTFDIGPLSNFPGAEKWYWKEQAEVYQQDTNILAICLILEGQIIEV